MSKETPHVAEQQPTFTPDFLYTPGIVAFDPDLQPLDSKVYSIIHWLERLKDGRCYASNSTIAKIVFSSSSGVANSLSRLRDKGYIACIYDDKGRRKEIRTLVFNTVNPYSNEEGGLTQMSNIKNKNRKSNIKSNLTDEQKDEIVKIYKLWCIYMLVDPETRVNGTTDARKLALQEASKRYRLTQKRRVAIAHRLKDAGYEMIVRAIKSIAQDPFYRDGENDREWKAGLEFLCRSYEKVEEWANKYPSNGGHND